MTNQDPLMSLVEIVNDLIAQGKSEDEIVGLLISSGLDEVKAMHVLETVKASRSSHFSEIIRFITISLVILSSLGFIVFSAIG